MEVSKCKKKTNRVALCNVGNSFKSNRCVCIGGRERGREERSSLWVPSNVSLVRSCQSNVFNMTFVAESFITMLVGPLKLHDCSTRKLTILFIFG